jgi:hypothetical protein
MKRLFAFIALCAFSAALHAQVVDTTICNILKDPVSFNGKMVRVKGTALADFDQFIVRDQGCMSQINALWLSYPEGAKGKAGPMAMLQLQPAKNFAGAFQPVTRTPVSLLKDNEFKEFDSLLSTVHKQDLTCLGCIRNEVDATFVGRLDAVAKAGVVRDQAGKIVSIDGFGIMNAFPARLVLQSVSGVTGKEIDFSKADAAVKSQPAELLEALIYTTMDSVSTSAMHNVHASASNAGNASVDALQALDQLRTAEKSLGPDSPILHALDRTTKAFDEHGSVLIGYGATDQVNEKEEVPSKRSSPDGVIFNCTFNTGRLHGAALNAATVHIGEHIADIRNPEPNVSLPTLFDLEYQAWVTTALNILSARELTLTVSGGYVLWNESWTQDERKKELDTAISEFLRRHEALSR